MGFSVPLNKQGSKVHEHTNVKEQALKSENCPRQLQGGQYPRLRREQGRQ